MVLILIGDTDMAFSWMNNISFWLFPLLFLDIVDYLIQMAVFSILICIYLNDFLLLH